MARLLLLLLALVGGPTAGSGASLQFTQSADGRSFAIRSAHAQWLASAGAQLNKTSLPTTASQLQRDGEPAPPPATTCSGTDALGAFTATAIDYLLPGGAKLTTTTRVYDATASPGRLVVVFEQQISGAVTQGLALGAATSTAQREVSLAWPTFQQPPATGPSPSPAPPPPANCTLLEETDFNGGDFQRLTGVPSPEACCELCTKVATCEVFVWYTAKRSGTTGNGTTSHCNLKSQIVKKLPNSPNHTAGICHSHAPPPASRGPKLNAFTMWGPSGMFNELSRLWSPGAFVNTASCGHFGNDKGCDSMGPLVMYDRNLTTLVIAPMSEFMVHAIAADSDTIRAGLRGTVASTPDGFALSTIMVGGDGVTDTVREWGSLMLKNYGKPPAAAVLQASYNADPSLRYLSYWTDAGAAYYYDTESENASTSMEQTMIDTKAWMRENRVPTHAYQFDSWWYPQDSKRPGGPVITWEPIRGPSPDSRMHGAAVIPDGFDFPWLDTNISSADGHTTVDHSPLIMHNRAFSPETTYNRSWFTIEKDLALPTDPALFKHIIEKAKPLGLKVYEQDWICLTHMKMNATQDNVHLARQWMLAMDAGAVASNMSIQLCMQYTRHVLQSLEMQSVTNARASTDYHAIPDSTCKYGEPNPTCTQYNIFLTGLIYSAVGIAPSKDNFRSSSVAQINGKREANPLIQTLASGLSGGPVGPSDQLGKMSFPHVHHICRGPDGYLNKPSTVATPLDLTYQLGFDNYAKGLDSMPFVQHAFSEITCTTRDSSTSTGTQAEAPEAATEDAKAMTKSDALRWHYLFAVDLAEPVTVRPEDLGLPNDSAHLAFEYFSECWRNETAVQKGLCTFELSAGHTTHFTNTQPIVLNPGGVRGDGLGGMHDPEARPFRYVLTAPVLSSGWVLLGETGKFFIATTDRFSDLSVGVGATQQQSQMAVSVRGASSERVTVELVPPHAVARAEAATAVENMGAADTQIETVKVHCALSAAGEARLSCEGSACTCS